MFYFFFPQTFNNPTPTFEIKFSRKLAMGGIILPLYYLGSGIKLVGLAHPQVAGSKEKIKFGRYTAVMAYTSTGEGITWKGK